MNDVEWRAVPGWEGSYEVSNEGQVRSLDRTLHFISRWGTPASRHAPGRILAAHPHPAGHMLVSLGRVSRYVHHLVLEAFVGSMPHGQEALHGNGHPADNRLVNLRWGTRGENNDDAVRHGTHHWASKQTCPRGHDLRAPNLVPGKIPTRQCLACDRARNAARSHGYTEELTQKDADRRYQRIMAGLDAPRRGRRRRLSQAPAQGGTELSHDLSRDDTAPGDATTGAA